MAKLKITLYGEAYSSKNSRQIFKIKERGKKARTIISKSKNAKNQEIEYYWKLKDARNKKIWAEMTGNLAYPYLLHIKIYRRTKASFDYDNVTHNLRDMMKQAGYVPDDSARYLKPVYEDYEVDPGSPRVEIWVEQATEPQYLCLNTSHNLPRCPQQCAECKDCSTDIF